MADTRHLDNAIKVLGGARGGKRKTTTVALHHDAESNYYLIQVGSRVVDEGVATLEQATTLATHQRDRVQGVLGRPVGLEVHKSS